MARPEHLPLFGRWIVMFCELLDYTQPELAERAGLAQSAVSKIARGETKPEDGSANKLWDAIAEIAREQKWALDAYARECFLNAAGEGYVSERQIAASETNLSMFMNGVRAKREVERLTRLVERQRVTIEAQKAEIKTLKAELRKERNRIIPWQDERS